MRNVLDYLLDTASEKMSRFREPKVKNFFHGNNDKMVDYLNLPYMLFCTRQVGEVIRALEKLGSNNSLYTYKKHYQILKILVLRVIKIFTNMLNFLAPYLPVEYYSLLYKCTGGSYFSKIKAIVESIFSGVPTSQDIAYLELLVDRTERLVTLLDLDFDEEGSISELAPKVLGDGPARHLFELLDQAQKELSERKDKLQTLEKEINDTSANLGCVANVDSSTVEVFYRVLAENDDFTLASDDKKRIAAHLCGNDNGYESGESFEYLNGVLKANKVEVKKTKGEKKIAPGFFTALSKSNKTESAPASQQEIPAQSERTELIGSWKSELIKLQERLSGLKALKSQISGLAGVRFDDALTSLKNLRKGSMSDFLENAEKTISLLSRGLYGNADGLKQTVGECRQLIKSKIEEKEKNYDKIQVLTAKSEEVFNKLGTQSRAGLGNLRVDFGNPRADSVSLLNKKANDLLSRARGSNTKKTPLGELKRRFRKDVTFLSKAVSALMKVLKKTPGGEGKKSDDSWISVNDFISIIFKSVQNLRGKPPPISEKGIRKSFLTALKVHEDKYIPLKNVGNPPQ
jgi:hypothetical protein